MPLSYDDVRRELGLDAMHDAWRATFDASGTLTNDPEALPQGQALRELCVELRFPDLVVEPLVESAGELAGNEALTRLLAHGRWMLRNEVRRVGSWLVPWGRLPDTLGQTGRLFHAFVFLSDAARIRRLHREIGIDDAVSIDTLSDLGVHLRHYHRMYGCFGFEEPAWISLHYSGLLFRLGRLQFEMSSWRVPPAKSARCALSLGDPILDIHIAEIGPLLPDACDASIARAREFFPRHFPDFDFRAFGCWSWLLDPQLGEYLPTHSNIMMFQNRFRAVPTEKRHDGPAVQFVFRMHPDTPLDELPQRTTLERAVVSHLRAGRKWSSCLGYF